MNNNTKIIIWVIVIVVILGGIWFYYYYNKNNTNNNSNTSENVEPVEDNTSTSSYYKELVSFLPTELMGEVTYNGSLEHSHIISFDSAVKKSNSVEYTGKIQAEAEATKEDLNFKEKYIVEGDTLKLMIMNTNRLFFQSMVKDLNLLQGPVQAGNGWSQEVSIENKSYVAKYEIKDVGDKDVTVDMTIEGMKGYANDTYKESYTLTKGKGVTDFNTVILTGKKGEDKIPIDFKYSLYSKDMK